MPVNLARKINGKKFMWDGMVYQSGDQAESTVEEYRKDGFSAEMITEDESFLVYTRRVSSAQKQES